MLYKFELLRFPGEIRLAFQEMETTGNSEGVKQRNTISVANLSVANLTI
jgi:hypothetical protein